MAVTPNLKMINLTAGQASAEITVNSFLDILDAVVQSSVVDITNTPPVSPSNGNVYIVGTAGTGVWSGQDENLAAYYGGWIFIVPIEGWKAWVRDEDRMYLWDGTAWVQEFLQAPLMTIASRPSAASSKGRIIYNTDDTDIESLQWSDGTIWRHAYNGLESV